MSAKTYNLLIFEMDVTKLIKLIVLCKLIMQIDYTNCQKWLNNKTARNYYRSQWF